MSPTPQQSDFVPDLLDHVDESSGLLDWALLRKRALRAAVSEERAEDRTPTRAARQQSGVGECGGSAISAPQKLLIVDWDDTVLPTSFLVGELGIAYNAPASEIPPVVRHALNQYAYRVKGTFELLEAHGRVVIVTNAKHGWIESSCARFLPAIESLIRSYTRISAQPADPTGIDDRPEDWKEKAFVTLAQKHFDHPVGQPIFSLGDSIFERDALWKTSMRLGVVAQSVKLLDHPSIETLEAEHASMQEDGLLNELLGRTESFDLYYDVFDGLKPWIGSQLARGLKSAAHPVGLARPTELDTDTPKSQKSTSTCSTATSSTVQYTVLEGAESGLWIRGRCLLPSFGLC